MDWSEERYVRVYTRDTADLLAFGWEGRLVWYELLRKADRCGVIEHGGDLDILPELLRVPPEIFRVGLERIVKRRSAQVTDRAIVIPNHVPANEAKQSDAHRQRESRARRRQMAMSGTVTNRDVGEQDGAEEAGSGAVSDRDVNPDNVALDSEDGRTVTNRDAMESRNVSPASRVSRGRSQDVTPSLAVPSSQSARPSSASPSPTPIVRTPSDHVRAHVGGVDPPRDAYQAAADELWQEQEQAKADMRAAGVDPQSRGLGMVHPAKLELVRRIADQAANGRGLEVAVADCRHVLAVLLAEAKVSRVLRWIDGGHWEPKRFAQLLSQSPSLAVHRAREKRDAGGPGSSPPQPPRINATPVIEVAPEDIPTPEELAELGRHFGVHLTAEAGSG